MRPFLPSTVAFCLAVSTLPLGAQSEPPEQKDIFSCTKQKKHTSVDWPGTRYSRDCFQYQGFSAGVLNTPQKNCRKAKGTWAARACPLAGAVGVCCRTVLDATGGRAIFVYYPDWQAGEAGIACGVINGEFFTLDAGHEKSCVKTAEIVPGPIQPEADLVLVKGDEVVFRIEWESPAGLYRPPGLPAACAAPGDQAAEEDGTEQPWGRIYTWWKCDGAARRQWSGEVYRTKFPKAGIFEVEARIQGDPPAFCHGEREVTQRKVVRVVEVDSVEITSGHGSVLVKGRESIALEAKISPTPQGLDPAKVQWRVLVGGAVSGAAGTLASEEGLTNTFTKRAGFTSSARDDVRIQARAGALDDWKEVELTVAEVEKLVSLRPDIADQEVLFAGPLEIPHNTFELEAKLLPKDSGLDPSQIEWQLVNPPAGTLTGTGLTRTFTPNGAFVSGGKNDVVIQARAGAGDDWSQFRVTLAEIEKVEWRQFRGLVENAPPPAGGKRIFPGSEIAGESVDRKDVEIVATIRPQLPDELVIFRLFDVDDTTDPAFDPRKEIDTNGPDPTDNLGDAGSLADLLRQDHTDSSGEAVVRFKVSLYPGDNYRAGAYFRDLRDFGADDTTVLANNNATNPPLPGKFSEILTVWRRLHIENDSMPTVPAGVNVVTGTIAEIDPPTLSREIPEAVLNRLRTRVTLETDFDLDEDGDENRFEGGTLEIHGVDTFFVVESSGWEVTVADVVPIVPGAVWSFTLRDDDDPKVLPAYDLFRRGEPLLTNAFARAFVKPVEVDGNPRELVPFQLHLSKGDVKGTTGWRDSRDCPTADRLYWCHLLVSAFQSDKPVDWDPDAILVRDPSTSYPSTTGTEGETSGLTAPPRVSGILNDIISPNRDSESAIFLETARDVRDSRWKHASLMHAIVHEIGHSVVKHVPGAIMTKGSPSHVGGKPVTDFLPNTVRKIREAAEKGW